MRILNYGSLNIDHVYSVEHFVRPGETMAIDSYEVFPGGKGANQSTALALAGADVAHAGKLGADGAWYKDRLAKAGVDVSYVEIIDGASGHAIIQVNASGENSIILFGGANLKVTAVDAEKVIGAFRAGDYLLLQNEISAMPDIMRRAAKQGMRIVFNPAPMGSVVQSYPLELVSIFVVNEIEGMELSGEKEPARVTDAMRARFPNADVVMTLGGRGVVYASGTGRISLPAHKVTPVDTTGAGDTFLGYFLAEVAAGRDAHAALTTASKPRRYA